MTVVVNGKKYKVLWETTAECYESSGEPAKIRAAELLRQSGCVSSIGLKCGGKVLHASRRADGSIKIPVCEGE